MRLNTFFYLSHLIFCDSNSAASSAMHGETHGGGRVVPSRIVVENGSIGFACTIFSIRAISPRRARSMDASHSGREPQHWQKEGGAAFLGRWFGGRLSYSLDEFGMEVMVSGFVMDELLIYST
jgi:hypothetical protein